MTKIAPAAPASDWPRLLLGCGIGAVLGVLALGAVLAAWWLAIARHEVQTTPESRGPELERLEARLEAAAGPAAFGLTPVYAYDPKDAGATWLSQIAPELEAQGRQIRPVPADDRGLQADLDRLASRWAEPGRRPLLIWRDATGLRLCRCDHPRARALARQALARQAEASDGQGEAVQEATPALPSEVPASASRADPTGRPYPRLGPPPLPPTRTDAAPVGSTADARPASPAPSLPGDPASARPPASPPAPRRPSPPRRTEPPEARRDAESLFF